MKISTIIALVLAAIVGVYLLKMLATMAAGNAAAAFGSTRQGELTGIASIVGAGGNALSGFTNAIGKWSTEAAKVASDTDTDPNNNNTGGLGADDPWFTDYTKG